MSTSLSQVRTFIADLSGDFQGSQLMPRHLRNQADLALVMHMGDVLGIDPRQAIWSMHVIEGKPSMSADLMAAVCMRSQACEYLMPITVSATRCEYAAKRRGWPAEVRMSFTWEDAQRAGLTGRDNWKKYPAAMLKARCLTMICRSTFPDLLAGVYDGDELARESSSEQPMPVQAQAQAQTSEPKRLDLTGHGIKAQVSASPVEPPKVRRKAQAQAQAQAQVIDVEPEQTVQPEPVQQEPEPVESQADIDRRIIRQRIRELGATVLDLVSFAEHELGRHVGPPDEWSEQQCSYISSKLRNGWAARLVEWVHSQGPDLVDLLPD
ncbi:MAG: hypothetical protein B7C55_09900 [Actinomycetales bacterium mxb001]|nr:MAG: hypothetical protein B7C55_09900 [Actinomycetales bacterium mxb001]